MRCFLLAALFVHIGAGTDDVVCNNQCAQGQFCLHELCFDCLNCTKLHRESPPCAQTPADCGTCLEGYQEVPLTSNSRYKKACNKRDERECRNDADCPKMFFCHESQTCNPCIDCRTFLRQRLSTALCAKSVYDCGLCLPGYHEIAVTFGSRPKPCQPNASFNVNEAHISLIITLLIVLCFTSMAISWVVVFRRGKQSGSSDRVESAVTSPPPYTLTENTEASDTIVCGFYKETPENESMARIFRLPEYAVENINPESGGSNENTVFFDRDSERAQYAWSANNSGLQPCGGDTDTSLTERPDDDSPREPDAKRRR